MRPGSDDSAATCPQCGYDLSGTRPAGIARCPECGGTVQSSRRRLADARRSLDRADRLVTLLAVIVVLLVLTAIWLAR